MEEILGFRVNSPTTANNVIEYLSNKASVFHLIHKDYKQGIKITQGKKNMAVLVQYLRLKKNFHKIQN